LPTLIRQCKADRKWEERVDAAETLAYLIEVDIHLQNTAAISDQIITTLNEYFKYPGSPPDASLMPTTKVQFEFLVLYNRASNAVPTCDIVLKLHILNECPQITCRCNLQHWLCCYPPLVWQSTKFAVFCCVQLQISRRWWHR